MQFSKIFESKTEAPLSSLISDLILKCQGEIVCFEQRIEYAKLFFISGLQLLSDSSLQLNKAMLVCVSAILERLCTL